LDKSRDTHIDEFQGLADQTAEKWETIIGTMPRYSGGGLDDDTLRRFGEVIRQLAEAQARVNTMLSDAIDQLESGGRI